MSRMQIGPRRTMADYWIPNGTRYEAFFRLINGTEYRFIRISHVDGSRTFLAEPIGWERVEGHAWTVTPDGRVF
jgi:hypothetical protein